MLDTHRPLFLLSIQPDCQRSAQTAWRSFRKTKPQPASKAVMGATSLHPDPSTTASGQHRLHPEIGNLKELLQKAAIRVRLLRRQPPSYSLPKNPAEDAHRPLHILPSSNLPNLGPSRKWQRQLFCEGLFSCLQRLQEGSGLLQLAYGSTVWGGWGKKRLRRKRGESMYTEGGSGDGFPPRFVELPPFNTDGNRDRDRHHDHNGNHESDHRLPPLLPDRDSTDC
jgi:hypothetical protein